MKTNTSSATIILTGYLMVNIPVIIIILILSSFLVAQFHLNNRWAVLLGVLVAWGYWWLVIPQWIKWALKKNVDPVRLHKLGVRSLLLWKSDMTKIEKIAAEINKKG